MPSREAVVSPVLRAVAVVAATSVLVVALVGLASLLGAASAGFALGLLWLTMCWLTVVSWVVPLRLPAGYFELRGFEHQGGLYRRFGVTVAKRLLRRGPMTLFNPGLKLPATRDAAGLARLDRSMRGVETNHLILFVIGLAVAGHGLARRWWGAAGWSLLGNLVINGYPVLLQRYNRGRLAGLRARLAGAGHGVAVADVTELGDDEEQ
jgi:hypothetical protein